MRSLVLSAPDAHRWGLESLLRNAGYDVEHRDDPRSAGALAVAEDFDLVIVDEQGDGSKFTAVLLRAMEGSTRRRPPILCMTKLPNVVARALGAAAGLVRMTPAPLDGLMLRMHFESLGLPWSPTPANRKVVSPPAPERPWGRVGMKQGTVDAAGLPSDGPPPARPADGDEAAGEEQNARE